MIINRYKEFQRIAAIGQDKYVPALNRIEFIYVGPEQYHIVQTHEVGNLPLISYSHYNTPLLWWVLALHNRIRHPMFDFAANDVIRIPSDPFAIERGISML